MAIKTSTSRKIFVIFNYTFLAILALICIFPFIHLLALSFSSDEFTSKGLVSVYPMGFTLDAYMILATKPEFFKAFGISVARTILGTSLALLVIILTAYPLSKSNKVLKGRTAIAWIFVFTMFFGGTLASQYVLYRMLGLLDNFLVYILPGACDVWFVLMLMNFFRGIPKEIEEAALIDGCNHFQILFRIFVPISLPVIVTIVLFTAVGHWNSWFDGIFFMNDSNMYPLQSYLYVMLESSDPSKLAQNGTLTPDQLEALKNLGNKNLQAAQIFLGMLPITLVYPFLQKFFIKGITIGSVKG
ncbi:MAG: carbohydrate ABC transporter permease [Candidatus Onthovivens sp.]|nr:carbohydrate ABC transporter permease [Mollicutes bacterium]MDD6468867.1 carbohydrate ABC transporter permease [Bacilli bacterium]MDY3761580.1 carbohydrate ABC transporter permease [Candidatus Onthovivens sp.]MCI6614287.1 carbohydrate ABC transporter permease [Mollicutes bacterium]MCI7040219.1 carbohydrate ABC transporter permease [Mollicutes bacterium]